MSEIAGQLTAGADLSCSNSLTDLAARIRIELTGARNAAKRSAEHALATGDLLLEAKAQLAHGQWLPWFRDHCEISDRTARLYMRLARNRQAIESEIGNVADLTLRSAVEAIAPASNCRDLKEDICDTIDDNAVVIEMIKQEISRQPINAINLLYAAAPLWSDIGDHYRIAAGRLDRALVKAEGIEELKQIIELANRLISEIAEYRLRSGCYFGLLSQIAGTSDD
jgi:hypothetical protein